MYLYNIYNRHNNVCKMGENVMEKRKVIFWNEKASNQHPQLLFNNLSEYQTCSIRIYLEQE